MRTATWNIGPMLLAAGLLGRIALATAPTGQYTVNETLGTVTDNKSGLIWQRGASSTKRTWSEAATDCGTLSLGGFTSGWRLPTKFELETIVDIGARSPAIDTTAFLHTAIEVFWSSTPYAPDAAYAWGVNFVDGTSFGNLTSGTGWVRCVR